MPIPCVTPMIRLSSFMETPGRRLTTELNMVSKLQCDHIFHATCIEPWLQLYATCLTCRRSLMAAGAEPAPADPSRARTTPGISRASRYAKKHKQCISLSEQQAMDCTKNEGCAGGDMVEVMQELAQDEAACMKESDYPFIGQKATCRENKNKKAVTVINGEMVNITNEDDLLKLLYTYGPLTVGLDGRDFDKYQSGILIPDICEPLFPRPGEGHAVLLVGYGEEKGEKFWIIKNSWGTEWGEKGYVRLQRGVYACGIGKIYTAKAEVA